MANMFSIILVIATLGTGFLWCLHKFFFIRKSAFQSSSTVTINDQIVQKILKKDDSKFKWLETGASFFPVLAIVLLVRSFIYEPFQIPSGSMMPTLLIGDFILVEKFTYGIKDPIFQKTIIKTGYPKRQDIVVFKYPKDPGINYIKRVVGLPGDKITYDSINKEIIIQVRCVFGSACENRLPITYSNIEESNFVQTFSQWNSSGESKRGFFQLPRGESKKNGIRLVERTESVNNLTYRILNIPIIQDQLDMYYQQPGQELATWIVPPNQYFMMGDNRDNSADSRYWGFVPEENLIGKATAVWMSFEKQEGEWPTGIRLDRIGRIY